MVYNLKSLHLMSGNDFFKYDNNARLFEVTLDRYYGTRDLSTAFCYLKVRFADGSTDKSLLSTDFDEDTVTVSAGVTARMQRVEGIAKYQLSFECDEFFVQSTIFEVNVQNALGDAIDECLDFPEAVNRMQEIIEDDIGDLQSSVAALETAAAGLSANAVKKALVVTDKVARKNGDQDISYIDFDQYGSVDVVCESLSVNDSEVLTAAREVTYSDLSQMIVNDLLVSGQKYRITDYSFSVNAELASEVRSAGHPFDIIVTATGANTLDERALAVRRSGDTYYADSDLDKWTIKYSFSNDSTRFDWADTQSGKGVIYHMKDEWGNECGYDFKNALFKGVSPSSDVYYAYTFSSFNGGSLSGYIAEINGVYDASVRKTLVEGEKVACGNVIGDARSTTSNGKRTLNFITILSEYADQCHDNIFGRECLNVVGGKNFYKNVFGCGCHHIKAGDDFCGNNFGCDVKYLSCTGNSAPIKALFVASGVGGSGANAVLDAYSVELENGYPHTLTVGDDGKIYIRWQAETASQNYLFKDSASDLLWKDGSAIGDLLNEKADVDGHYEDMCVGVSGLSGNLINRSNSIVPAEYVFRTSGGDEDVGSGKAVIKRIKGSSVIFNQLVKDTYLQSGSASGLTVTVGEDGSVTVDGTCGETAPAYAELTIVDEAVSLKKGHKYLWGCYVPYTVDVGENLKMTTNKAESDEVAEPLGFAVLTCTGDVTAGFKIKVKGGVTVDQMKIYPQVIDLTLMFGFKNELTDIAAFKSLFAEKYYPYGDGTVVNFSGTAIKTVGYNAYDPITGQAWLFKGYVYQITGDYTSLAFTDRYGATAAILPDECGKFTPPEDGTLFVTGGSAESTCVHLAWSGYRDGEYKAYRSDTLSLPDLTAIKDQSDNALFPYGLRSAGESFDEITESRAVKRVFGAALSDIPQWNQLVPSASIEVSMTLDNQAASNGWGSKICNINVPIGHKVCALLETTDPTYVAIGWGSHTRAFVNGNNLLFGYDRTPCIYTTTEIICGEYGGSNYGAVHWRIFSGAAAGTYTAKMQLYDLTEIFGAGNEPTSVEEVTMLFPDGDYPYKAASANADGSVAHDYAYIDGTNYLYSDTPVVVNFDERLDLSYYVDDFGTEKVLPYSSGIPLTSPIRCEVVYVLNAVDAVRNLPKKVDAIEAAIPDGAGAKNKFLVATNVEGFGVKPRKIVDTSSQYKTIMISKNTKYNFGTLRSLTLSFPSSASDGDIAEVNFLSGSTPTAFSYDATNAIYSFTGFSSNVFVEITAKYKQSIGKWVVRAAET